MASLSKDHLIKDDGRMSAPLLALLQTAFQFDENILLKTRWIKYDRTLYTQFWAKLTGIPSKTKAAVMGNLVVHDGATDRSVKEWFRLMVHEQVHVIQIANKGVMPFYFNYLLEAAAKPYREISFEMEAFRYGSDQKGNDLALKLWHYGQNAIGKIFADTGLDEKEKVQILTEVGRLFHSEVMAKDSRPHGIG
jgi:hypothetical protein